MSGSGLSLKDFLSDEIRNEDVEHESEQGQKALIDARNQQKRVYNCLGLPWHFEPFIWFGFLLCLDQFLFMFTVYPVRLITGWWHASKSSSRRAICDMFRFILLASGLITLCLFDMSRWYHYIRGQSVLKLYVIFNMSEIVDRLLCSMGEDVLDSLFGTAHMSFLTLCVHLLIGMLYISVHASLKLFQFLTLNVSVNTSTHSLFMLLVSNNFVELKSAVFKRFRVANLYQLAVADIVERVRIFAYLALVVIHNMSHMSESAAVEWLSEAFYYLLMVFFGEMAVDWVKHGFITKFNKIPPYIYRQFMYNIAKRYTTFVQKRKAYSYISFDPEYFYGVSRKFGFPHLVYVVLCLRVAAQPLLTLWRRQDLAPAVVTCAALIAAVLILFVVLKAFLSVFLLGFALKRLKSMEEEQEVILRLSRESKLRKAALSKQGRKHARTTRQPLAVSSEAAGSAYQRQLTPFTSPKGGSEGRGESSLPARTQTPGSLQPPVATRARSRSSDFHDMPSEGQAGADNSEESKLYNFSRHKGLQLRIPKRNAALNVPADLTPTVVRELQDHVWSDERQQPSAHHSALHPCSLDRLGKKTKAQGSYSVLVNGSPGPVVSPTPSPEVSRSGPARSPSGAEKVVSFLPLDAHNPPPAQAAIDKELEKLTRYTLTGSRIF